MLLLTIGSSGDVHPFIGLALALRARGHQVKLITNPFFGEIADRVGLELVPLGSVEFFKKSLANPLLWDKKKGVKIVFDMVLNGLRETYDAVANNHVPGETVLVCSSLGLAGRIAQDKLGIPTVTVHLAPSQFRSCNKPPKLAGVWMPPWMPMWVKRAMWSAADRLFIDRLMAPRVNALRAELNLPPVKGILRDFWNSPQRVIGLFPDWFGDPQADWPTQTRLTGFPRYDEADACDIDPALEQFLNHGDPPILFTPGSAMYHAHDFFIASVEACKQLGGRGLLLTKHAEQIPALPETIRHFSYVPFSRVFRCVAAVVHHGGIGTSAQALAAGCRQLITPFAHDQFDNADRLVRLGVGRSIPAKKYTAKSATRELSLLLADAAAGEACRMIADRLRDDDSVSRTCDLIEELFVSSL